MFIVWPWLWERSPNIAVVCVSVSVLNKGISQLILLLTLCACRAPADRPTASLFIFIFLPTVLQNVQHVQLLIVLIHECYRGHWKRLVPNTPPPRPAFRNRWTLGLDFGPRNAGIWTEILIYPLYLNTTYGV